MQFPARTEPISTNKQLQDAIALANWCIEHEIHPADAAKLCKLANDARLAEERTTTDVENASQHEARADRLRSQFETTAREVGFTKVEWPSIRPSLERPIRDDERRSGTTNVRVIRLPL